MVDTVATKIIFESPKRLIVHLTCKSDGTGESNVVKVDKSTFTGQNGLEPSKLCIEKIQYDVASMRVELSWDETSDETIAILQGFGKLDFYRNGKSQRLIGSNTGGAGDIFLTSVNAAVGDGYDITLYIMKKD